MGLYSRLAGASALIAATAMAATPVSAVELPTGPAHAAVPAIGAWDGGTVNADQYRRYRRHHGLDAGDVIAGVVILGGIAAIASAASNSSRNRDYRDRDYRYRSDYPYRDRPYQYRPYRGDSRTMDSNGINRAIDMCVREVERDRRIESVDSVDRLTSGWRVEGAVSGGEGFTCLIGNDGRIDDIDYGQRRWNGAYGETGAGVDRQWDDDAYAQARREQDAQAGQQPAYPGGPVDGDDDYDSDDDGRYQAAQAPDFGA